ncbi:hypothetical protein VTN02DRAFT_4291 [Thermoascus thermophilus]
MNFLIIGSISAHSWVPAKGFVLKLPICSVKDDRLTSKVAPRPENSGDRRSSRAWHFLGTPLAVMVRSTNRSESRSSAYKIFAALEALDENDASNDVFRSPLLIEITV